MVIALPGALSLLRITGGRRVTFVCEIVFNFFLTACYIRKYCNLPFK